MRARRIGRADAAGGFQRVELKPGEARRLALTAEPQVVADYDTALPGWRIAAGTYRVERARDAAGGTIVRTVGLEARRMRP